MRSHDLKCLKLFVEEGMTYSQISDKLDLTYDEVKHALKRARALTGEESSASRNSVNFEESFLKLLKKGVTKEEISDYFAINEDKVDSILDDLIANGICIDNFDGFLKLGREATPENRIFAHKGNSWKGDVLRFGVISDTHLCSKYYIGSSLNDYYDIIEQEEIDTVYHAGDLLDGAEVYTGHLYELMVIGSDDQIEYVVDNYPERSGVKTKFITGNHDLSFYKKGGRDVGKSIANERDDLEYLGQLGAYVDLSGKHVSSVVTDMSSNSGPLLYLVHPDGGNPYAVSYRAQILARGFTEQTKPDIMIVGHLHQIEYFVDRGIHIVQAGAFQGMTPYLRRKGIHPKIGGWIVEVGISGKNINSFSTTFIPFSEF